MRGANAVKGVVNIITKKARDTQALRATASVGSGQLGAELGFGGSVRGDGYYCIFSKYTDGEGTQSGRLSLGGMRSLHGGVRAHWSLSGKDSLTMEAALFHTISGTTTQCS